MEETLETTPSGRKLVGSVLTTVIEDYAEEAPKAPVHEVSKESGLVVSFAKEKSKSGDLSHAIIRKESSRGWIFDFLHQLTGWIERQQHPTLDGEQQEHNEEELWKDWEWVLSKTEELSMQQTKEEADRIRNELLLLRKAASMLKFRPFYANQAKLALSKRTKEEVAAIGSVLDASKRSKLIADTINHFQERWLEFIRVNFFLQGGSGWKEFKSDYEEKPYLKNVVGSLNELAFSASHGPKDVGLDSRVLSDIMWSMWKTLTSAIRSHLERSLEEEELTLIAKEILPAQTFLIEIWLQTAQNSRLGATNEGALVGKWETKDKEEHERILKIKKQGVDARYSYEPYKWKEVDSQYKRDDIKDLKKILEEQLSSVYSTRN